METVNIHEAKTHLSKLLERVTQGESFVIAKLTAADTAATAPERRLGFLAGEIQVPDDFDHMGQAEIARLF